MCFLTQGVAGNTTCNQSEKYAAATRSIAKSQIGSHPMLRNLLLQQLDSTTRAIKQCEAVEFGLVRPRFTSAEAAQRRLLFPSLVIEILLRQKYAIGLVSTHIHLLMRETWAAQRRST